MKILSILALAFLLASCASTQASKCERWTHDDTRFALGIGYVYKQELFKCTQFKEE